MIDERVLRITLFVTCPNLLCLTPKTPVWKSACRKLPHFQRIPELEVHKIFKLYLAQDKLLE